jgi:putative tricarboxylic transport membrane protein
VRRYEGVTAAVFAIVAAVAMFDSRRGALIGATRDPGGIGSGFYPFWSAAVLLIAALLLMYRSSISSQSAERDVVSHDGLVAVGKLVIPMVAAVASMVWLGFYLTIAMYMAFFARYIGSYRWPWVGAIAITVPLLVYVVFEQGFRMLLPKSILYGYLLAV